MVGAGRDKKQEALAKYRVDNLATHGRGALRRKIVVRRSMIDADQAWRCSLSRRIRTLYCRSATNERNPATRATHQRGNRHMKNVQLLTAAIVAGAIFVGPVSAEDQNGAPASTTTTPDATAPAATSAAPDASAPAATTTAPAATNATPETPAPAANNPASETPAPAANNPSSETPAPAATTTAPAAPSPAATNAAPPEIMAPAPTVGAPANIEKPGAPAAPSVAKSTDSKVVIPPDSEWVHPTK